MTPDAHVHKHDAVVLAGGGARRLGGTDKPSLTVGARTLLDRVLSACADASTTVVVGPRRPTGRPVTWVREDPPGGGPLSALGAGLRGVTAETVLLLSADLPFLRAETVRTLLAALETAPPEDGSTRDGNRPDGSTGAGPAEGAGAGAAEEPAVEGALVNDGRDQPLLAAYRTESLRRELALLHTEYGSLTGLPLRLLLPELRLRRIDIAAGGRPTTTDALDCDTWEDVAAARARIREHDTVLDEWMAAAKAELGIELDVDTAALLDLARDAAHGVARPAAPLTTFLVGYAAAQRGGSPEQVAEAAAKAARLAARWAEEGAEQGEGRQGEGEQGGSR